MDFVRRNGAYRAFSSASDVCLVTGTGNAWELRVIEAERVKSILAQADFDQQIAEISQDKTALLHGPISAKSMTAAIQEANRFFGQGAYRDAG